MVDRPMNSNGPGRCTEDTLVCVYLGVVAIVSGCLMIGSGLGMHWMGLGAFAAGGTALYIGFRHPPSNAMPASDTTKTDSYTAANFPEEDFLFKDGMPPGFYTEDDFPSPDPIPGGTNHTGEYSGLWEPMASDAEMTFAVVIPSHSCDAHALMTIGERLKAWQSSNNFVRRIEGISQLLDGAFPETPAHHLWLSTPPLTERVALIWVAPSANNLESGNSLKRALEGMPIAAILSPAYYTMMMR